MKHERTNPLIHPIDHHFNRGLYLRDSDAMHLVPSPASAGDFFCPKFHYHVHPSPSAAPIQFLQAHAVRLGSIRNLTNGAKIEDDILAGTLKLFYIHTYVSIKPTYIHFPPVVSHLSNYHLSELGYFSKKKKKKIKKKKKK
jgi:hypothetical protein